jgi:hypothetical protein
MNRRERLMKTLNGKAVDRPAVSFYEINGLDEISDETDHLNIYNHPSWKPLIELASQKSDRIVMRSVSFNNEVNPIDFCTSKEVWNKNDSIYTRISIKTRNNILTATTRRDPDVNTVWQIEHLLKNLDDLKSWIEIRQSYEYNQSFSIENVVCSPVLDAELALGDSGIVMLDTADPICIAASMFDLGTFTIIATTEKAWFHQLLDILAEDLWKKTEIVSQALPGRLWRIYGPEYASPPYLNPLLFHEYVVAYDIPMIQAIHKNHGFARIHCHGRIQAILDEIFKMDPDGLDPIEPPPQGDVALKDVRKRYGHQMVLFGNLEASDLENLPSELFKAKITQALAEGTSGKGRGFVLLPSSCPYGRILSNQALSNYEMMIQCVEDL